MASYYLDASKSEHARDIRNERYARISKAQQETPIGWFGTTIGILLFLLMESCVLVGVWSESTLLYEKILSTGIFTFFVAAVSLGVAGVCGKSPDLSDL